jgi:hypothetical protein
MKRFSAYAPALITACVLALPLHADAQGRLDHLKCHKMRDALAPHASADLIAELQPEFSSNDCKILRAKLFCEPVTVSNVQPPPARPDIVGNPLSNGYVCYETRCPTRPADGDVTDRFGTHAQRRYRTSLLCVPARTQCEPTTCADQGADCGVIADGCGGTVDCGGCIGAEVCGGSGAPNVCAPPIPCGNVPAPPPETLQTQCHRPFPPPEGIPCEVPETSTVYYVAASSGDDANDGTTPDRAWATLCRAASAPAGSTVRVAAGTYTSADVTIDHPLIVKGGYDAAFGEWNPDLHQSIFAGRLHLSDDAAVFGGFRMIGRPVGEVGASPWDSWHSIEAGTLVRNYVEILYRASVDQHWFYAILASAPKGRTSHILCNDIYVQTEAAPGSFLNTDAIEYGNMASHLGDSELAANRICLDDHTNNWTSTVIDGYGTCGSTPASIYLTNNVIENAVASEPSAALEFYGCSAADLDLVLTNNTIASAGSGLTGYEGPPSTVHWKLTNNIVFATAGQGSAADVGSGAVDITSSEHNLLFGFLDNAMHPTPSYSEGDDTTGTTTPSAVFIQPGIGDFHLLPMGPGAGTGLNVYGLEPYGSVVVDLDQTPRPVTGPWDRGAY